MELLKETKEHKIFKKRSGRYAVQDSNGKWINGQDKITVLNGAGVIKVNAPKPKEEPAAEDAPAAAPAEEAAPADEAAE